MLYRRSPMYRQAIPAYRNLENRVKLSFLALATSFILSAAAMAAPTAKDAELLVTTTADKINVIVEGASTYFDTDPGRYYQQIGTTLDPHVDYDTFARGVMGHVASKRYVESLPEGERAAARANLPKFRDVLHDTLIKGYGKVFYNYAGSKFAVKSSELIGSGDRASVTQKVIDPQNKQYELQYTLNYTAEQGWKIQNVIVDGINMGQSYRAQFEEALDLYKGSVSDVIKNWPQIMDGHEDG
jgi:phospholipid transport system substrate-binding protein